MDKVPIGQLWIEMQKAGLHGWIDDLEGEQIRKEVEKLEAGQIYLEIGVAYGKSLATVSYYAKEGVKIFGIDRTDYKNRSDIFHKLGLTNLPTFVLGESQQEALKWKVPIDLLFLDGDHDYYGVISDMLSWIPFVKHGGRIMLHDYDPSAGFGVMRAVHNFIYPHDAYKDFEAIRSLYVFTKI